MSDAGSALGGQPSTGGGAVSPSFREALNAPPGRAADRLSFGTR